MTSELATRVFRIVDATDVPGFLGLLADDAEFVFANAEPLVGHDAIGAALGGFYQSIAGLGHECVHEWAVGDTTIVESTVTYARLDGQQVSVPATTIYHVTDGLIDSYRIYMDTTPVYA